MLDADLRARLDTLWDRFRAGGIANPVTVIDQINLLLFMRRLEDLDRQGAARAEAQGNGYQSIFADDASRCRWSWWSALSASEMFQHVGEKVMPWLRGLGNDDSAAGGMSAIARDATFVIPSASLLAEAVGALNELHVTDRNVDVQGDIYEYMLSHLQVAGALGQFRTPRHIIRAMVALVDPKLGETVIDPACGTGGFLIAAHQHVLAAGTSPEFITYDEAGAPQHLLGDRYGEAQWKVLRDPPLYGADVDQTFVRIATMTLVLHGIAMPKIGYANTLGRQYPHTPRADIVLANPPFSGTLDAAEVSNEFTGRSRKTELLFLELFIDLLAPGGRAAVVVPDSVLFSTQHAHVALRRQLVEKNALEAVVSLPAGVFKPYTGSSCAVLVFHKGGHTESVWMYDVHADGYSLDDRRRPVAENDLPDLLARWPGREVSDRSYVVPRETLCDWKYDLAVDTHAPFEMPQLPYQGVQELQRQALEAADELERRLRIVRGGTA